MARKLIMNNVKSNGMFEGVVNEGLISFYECDLVSDYKIYDKCDATRYINVPTNAVIKEKTIAVNSIGTSSYCETAYGVPTNNLTYELFILNNYGGSWTPMILFGNQDIIRVRSAYNYIRSNITSLFIANDLNANLWYVTNRNMHIVIRIKDGVITMGINNIKEYSINNSVLGFDYSNFQIGFKKNIIDTFNSELASIRLYDRYLTNEEINMNKQYEITRHNLQI